MITGRKWWTTGAADPRCRVLIVMGVTEPEAPPHRRQSMVLVPMDTPGVRIQRMLPAHGEYDAPHGHGEVVFDNVRVPKDNLLLGPGKGFAIAQGRLGPGRIHHCMRAIGAAEHALQLMITRGLSRVAFGKPILQLGGNLERVADARIAIEQARLLVLKTAWLMDTVGNKGAHSEIQAIKIVTPAMAEWVIDKAIQAHGGAGVSQDTPLAALWSSARSLRLADGPDEVHWHVVGRAELGVIARREDQRRVGRRLLEQLEERVRRLIGTLNAISVQAINMLAIAATIVLAKRSENVCPYHLQRINKEVGENLHGVS